MITADGRLLRASEKDHPDLFWAIRGGSGNFGVVSRFEFKLHALGPEVLTDDEPERLRAAYGPGYDRLVAAKNQYDPDNLFRMNQNIRPSA